MEDSAEYDERHSDGQHNRATQQDRQGIVVASRDKNPDTNGDKG